MNKVMLINLYGLFRDKFSYYLKRSLKGQTCPGGYDINFPSFDLQLDFCVFLCVGNLH